MSMDNCPVLTIAQDSKKGNTLRKATVLKDSNKKTSKKVRKPAKVKAARVFLVDPPFCLAIHNFFLSSIKYGEPAYPSSQELRKLGFRSCKGTSCRRKFRRLLPRFDIAIVHGALVFSSNLEEDVLVNKRSGKVVIAAEKVEQVIRRAHLFGSNERCAEIGDEAMGKHLNVRRTLSILEKHFTLKRREYGLTEQMVENFIARCKHCNGDSLSELNVKDKVKELAEHTDTAVNKDAKPVPVTTAEGLVSDHDKTNAELSEVRFVSMVAHVPDKSCIWYDRESIANSTNRFAKLIMVIGEMRGEMAMAVKGDVEAKQRLEAKLYCAQMLIKDHVKSLQSTLVLEDSPRVFRTQLDTLEDEYEQSGQRSKFKSDISDLFAHIKADKLVISPLFVQEIEDYLKPVAHKDISEESKGNMV